MSNSFIHDSQDSSVTDDVLRENIKINNSIVLSSDSSDSDLDSSFHIDVGNDPILKTLKSRQKSINQEESNVLNLAGNNLFKQVKIQQFDLGSNFDKNITKNLTVLNNESMASDGINDNLLQANTFVSQAEIDTKKLISFLGKSTLKKYHNIEYYINMLVNERVSSKYLDWFFFNQDSTITDISDIISNADFFLLGNNWPKLKELILKKYPTISDLLMSIGVSNEKLERLGDGNCLQLTTDRTYDPLAKLLPFDSVLQIIAFYCHEKGFLKIYFAIMLDRNFYELSNSYDNNLYDFLKIFSNEQILDSYFQLVSKDDYFMHYRFSRMIPQYKNILVNYLWKTDSDNIDESLEKLANEFNNLYDNSKYESLLYYILFIYGSDLLPIKMSVEKDMISVNHNNLKEYFINCIHNSTGHLTNDVELPLIKNILGIFNKIS
ncbi:hypothetical protein TPHA_0E02590 [Tetrapisispora phaffii CBS 4417]|uniref:Uncharacterized protein n=1 Tax=Tetrapisispora phaffii (strain ATCC 24235 / CBS 4417 / NBRC 1672 / NRRL Y-8282 / UCD 70-5) TaxID=1071381 RepID=G8BTX3_TETPH|nr:hypothetical protein TPHA_0E02590 [Tetrapisispora phaffii CBS 4417]CCE63351.1 hypothetical protein TPHA_0E02590 [Tetrapisispora phaffii CBS 4417]